MMKLPNYWQEHIGENLEDLFNRRANAFKISSHAKPAFVNTPKPSGYEFNQLIMKGILVCGFIKYHTKA